MPNTFIACNTLRDEIELVMRELKVDVPILWVESGLHNVPTKLHQAIQEKIDTVQNSEKIILLFGNCGNSLAYLSSAKCRIIFPKVDDCISLFLGGNEQRRELERQNPSYFFTKGYLRNESNIYSEYSYSVNKYGSEKAKKLFKRMLKNYRNLVLIDTKGYEIAEILVETREIAEQLGLSHKITEGSLKLIYKAFKEEWDNDFVIVEAGQVIGYNELGVGGKGCD